MDNHFGDLHWWPGDSTLEILIGAVLTQNTAWRNVERAIGNLKINGLIHMSRILKTERVVLEAMLRPAGFFRIKAERLTNLLRFVDNEYAGDLERMFTEELWSLREKLLAIRGIGEETADCILLYGGGKPVFVVDAYTRRILERHDLISSGAAYSEIQKLFMNSLRPDHELYGQYHALLVEVGKAFCKKIPQCGSCPLGCFLTARPILKKAGKETERRDVTRNHGLNS
ncbi:MAG: endonuclease III domain-containing protein [Syntrophaceae bacterium]|nr:endonuclease III domain-containing protein [Syntrophaceae bacterium]